MSRNFFFFNDTATTEIYTLSLHDALPISMGQRQPDTGGRKSLLTAFTVRRLLSQHPDTGDRKSTRLNSSHSQISYAVFCLKKKKITTTKTLQSRNYAKTRFNVTLYNSEQL